MPQPVDALVRIFRNQDAGLRIVADDGATVISARPSDRTITVEKDPYLQEGNDDARPQVVVGPVRGVSDDPFIGYQQAEVHVRVEIRIITRDWDSNTLGFTLADGDLTRNKVRDAIVSLVENNRSNPASDGSIVAWWMSGPGTDANDKTQSPPKYMTTLQVECMWLQ